MTVGFRDVIFNPPIFSSLSLSVCLSVCLSLSLCLLFLAPRMSVSISVFYDFRRRSALVDAKRDATNWSAVLTTESHLFCPLITPSHAGTGWLIAWRHTTTINSISTSVRRRSHWPVDARVFKYACSVIWREKQKKNVFYNSYSILVLGFRLNLFLGNGNVLFRTLH